MGGEAELQAQQRVQILEQLVRPREGRVEILAHVLDQDAAGIARRGDLHKSADGMAQHPLDQPDLALHPEDLAHHRNEITGMEERALEPFQLLLG